MKLGEFIKQYSHNNLIRLVYKCASGHEIVAETWNGVSMDWEIDKQQGIFRHYINNEVTGLASISVIGHLNYPDAINIVIERLENQPLIEEFIEDRRNCLENI